jgi:putative flavoprotein involved in K+ transport
MSRTQVVVIGAGQSGLAVSALLTAAAVDHVVVERGRTAQRWHAERWASLRLLTPNWMTRLPGCPPPRSPGISTSTRGPSRLRSCTTPRCTSCGRGGGYRVVCDAATFTADDAVVAATGYCQQAARHAAAERIHPSLTPLDATNYRSPTVRTTRRWSRAVRSGGPGALNRDR